MMNPSSGDRSASGAAAGWELTGNHYLSFPCVSPRDGGIHRLNVLHRGALGLLEWASSLDVSIPGSEALLAPRIREDGRDLVPAELRWERLDRWVPRFRAELDDGLGVQATLCAPGGGALLLPGAVYLIELENRSSDDRELEITLEGTWRWSLRTVASSRPLSAVNRVYRELGAGGVTAALELGGEPGLAALGVAIGGEGARLEVAVDDGAPAALGAGEEVAAENGRPLRIRFARTVHVAAGRRAQVAFYLAVAPERDGALARAADLREIGASELIRLGRLHLAQMLRTAADPSLGELLNRNLLFNVFFALGRAIDDERLYPLVSRSPLASSSAVFRERDALLWSLPALQLADPALAREALIRAFEQFSHRPGGNVHYLDGGLVSSAFALDQFCAYVVALDRYLREGGDSFIMDEPIIQDVLLELDDLLLDRLHPEVFLASTELLPSGERAVHPYVIYDNALIWAFCDALERLWPGGASSGERSNFAGAADEVAAAIWRHGTAEVEGLRVLAGSTDLAGEAAVYDDPEGSLALLPFLGFCSEDDPVWRNTMELLHSPSYPFWHGTRRFPGMGSRRHPELASLAGLCADLLGPRRDEALRILASLDLDRGLACSWYDPETGRGADGHHHAALAGFLAWTLDQALGGT